MLVARHHLNNPATTWFFIEGFDQSPPNDGEARFLDAFRLGVDMSKPPPNWARVTDYGRHKGFRGPQGQRSSTVRQVICPPCLAGDSLIFSQISSSKAQVWQYLLEFPRFEHKMTQEVLAS